MKAPSRPDGSGAAGRYLSLEGPYPQSGLRDMETMMQRHTRLSDLSDLPAPVLTAYVDINPANPRNQRTPRGYVTWLATAARSMSRRLPRSDRAAFRTQLERVDRYLRMEPPRGRGLVVFSGPNVWEAIPLQIEVAEELHWGKPLLQHMLWLLDEHRPRGVVVVDGSGARFFEFFLGAVTEDEPAAFSPNTSKWRLKHLVGPSHPGVSKRHGIQRDRARNQVTAQRKRFARELARRISDWSDKRAISPIILAGTNEIASAAVEALPAAVRKDAVIVPKALPAITSEQVKAKLGPELVRWEREYEEAVVERLVGAHASHKAVLGLDETLAALQDGRVRELVVARGLTGTVRVCTRCGRANASPDRACAHCGGEPEERKVRTLLPELAGRHAVPVEVVADRAARKLRQWGGIGAWLGSVKMPARRLARRRRSTAGRVNGRPSTRSNRAHRQSNPLPWN